MFVGRTLFGLLEIHSKHLFMGVMEIVGPSVVFSALFLSLSLFLFSVFGFL